MYVHAKQQEVLIVKGCNGKFVSSGMVVVLWGFCFLFALFFLL